MGQEPHVHVLAFNELFPRRDAREKQASQDLIVRTKLPSLYNLPTGNAWEGPFSSRCSGKKISLDHNSDRQITNVVDISRFKLGLMTSVIRKPAIGGVIEGTEDNTTHSFLVKKGVLLGHAKTRL